MSIINLKPEAVELLNQLCDSDNLESKIAVFEDAEQRLQDMAYQSDDKTEGYNLYDIAFSLKTYKKELIKLKTLIEDGNDS